MLTPLPTDPSPVSDSPAPPTAKRRRWIIPVALVAAVVTACAAPPPPPAIAGLDRHYLAATITMQGNNSYNLATQGPNAVNVTAPGSHSDSNTRVLFWNSATPDTADQQVCTTWATPSARPEQEGVVLRASSVGGRTRGIMVTKNVMGGYWAFNVHLVDTAASGGPLNLISSLQLRDTFQPGGAYAPGPWRICAKVTGNELSYVVWPSNHPKPAFGDNGYGTTVALPPDAPTSGQPGWYAGHIGPGQMIAYTDMEITAL